MKPLLLFLLLTATLHADPTLYHPAGWALGTVFPDRPETVEKKTPTPGGNVILEWRATVVQNGENFILERIEFPAALSPQQRDSAYEGGKAGMMRSTTTTLASEEKIQICGHEGRRYILESKDGLRVTDHRAVIIGSEIFVFVYNRHAKDPDSPASKAFFTKITQQTTRKKG